MFCDWCDCTIRPGDRFIQIGIMTICEDCIQDNMEENDPEGDYIDMQVNEAIERRLGIE